MNKVTLVITSCNRADLLERTVESFFKFNTYPIEEVIIIEDSGIKQNFKKIKNLITCKFQVIENEKNIGQIPSIDTAYSRVSTDYIFHCEDDWEFFQPGFIEKSFEILNVDSKIFTVWLRSYNEKKIKKSIDFSIKYPLGKKDFFYKILRHKGKPWQNGFTLNPGLRRTADCMLRHPYANLPIIFPKEKLSILGERDLAVYYGESGFSSAITSKEQGYIRHIGGKRHILLPWE
jgi:glycosyltransferase involved in cell wall biosynthesis